LKGGSQGCQSGELDLTPAEKRSDGKERKNKKQTNKQKLKRPSKVFTRKATGNRAGYTARTETRGKDEKRVRDSCGREGKSWVDGVKGLVKHGENNDSKVKQQYRYS